MRQRLTLLLTRSIGTPRRAMRRLPAFYAPVSARLRGVLVDIRKRDTGTVSGTWASTIIHAERRSDWETLVPGLRGLFVAASDVSACWTGSNEGPHSHYRGRLSATRARIAAEALGFRPCSPVPARPN